MAQQPTCANPLLLSFISEWLSNAKEHQTKGVHAYQKAYNSMLACPLTFSHPQEAQQLQGLGEKMCQRMADRLKEHCLQNGLPMPKKRGARGVKRNNQGVVLGQGSIRDEFEEMEAEAAGKKVRKPRPYVPALRSGAYALIMGLACVGEEVAKPLTKQELIELAQPMTDSSFTVPTDPTKFYTAWNSMNTLKDKDLVSEKGRPTKRYELTEEGWEVARRIRAVESRAGPASPAKKRRGVEGQCLASDQPTLPTVIAMPGSRRRRVAVEEDDDDFLEIDPAPTMLSPLRVNLTSRPSPSPSQSPERLPRVLPARHALIDGTDLPSFKPRIYPPGSFSVQLIIDTREVRAKNDRDYIQSELLRLRCPVTTRSLSLGDAQWVAVPHIPLAGGQKEVIMLPHILERKREDDLIASIKEGRFQEQKFRLRKMGPLIPAKHVTYLIEHITLNSDVRQKYGEAMESALASSMLVDDFFVKRTKSLSESLAYLARMTRILQDRYERQELRLVPADVISSENFEPLMKHLADNGLAGHRRHTAHGYIWTIDSEAFTGLSSKSDQLQLRDVYLKMLMASRGLSTEKALEVMKVWKTPKELIEAYDAEKREHPDEQSRAKAQREMVNCRTSGCIARRKIPKTLSAKLAEVWAGVSEPA